MSVCKKDREGVYVYERERVREEERESVYVSMCDSERESEGVRESVCEYV